MWNKFADTALYVPLVVTFFPTIPPMTPVGKAKGYYEELGLDVKTVVVCYACSKKEVHDEPRTRNLTPLLFLSSFLSINSVNGNWRIVWGSEKVLILSRFHLHPGGIVSFFFFLFYSQTQQSYNSFMPLAKSVKKSHKKDAIATFRRRTRKSTREQKNYFCVTSSESIAYFSPLPSESLAPAATTSVALIFGYRRGLKI